MSEISTMKSLTLFLFTAINLCMSTASLAANIQGHIVRDPKGVFLKIKNIPDTAQISVIFKLQSPSSKTLIQLGRLAEGDFVAANGNIDLEQKLIVVDSIEYVGLQNLLGKWYSEKKIFNFRSYSELLLQKPTPPYVADFKYSTLPSTGNDWTLFLSDTNNKRTILATIRFAKTTATLKLIDAETGEVAQTFRLSRQGANDGNTEQPSTN